MFSLVIGRYQPLHDGHIKLIRTLLNEGKRVCVAVRDTPLNADNPLTLYERISAIEREFLSEVAQEKVKVIEIPDIAEVCYGRKVGWGIREIRLDKETEAISATAIRKERNL